MESEEVNHEALYAACNRWASSRGPSFVRWDFDEMVHEAFLIAIKQAKNYDPKKGSLDTFLRPRLFEPLRRAYAKTFGERIERRRCDGVYKTRRFYRWTENADTLPDVEATATPPTMQLSLPPGSRENVCQLLARGLTQAQAARSLGVSESAIYQSVQRLRDDFRDVC